MNNWKFKLLICILSALLISSCWGKKSNLPELRTLTLHFKADPAINDQVLLPVDIIVTPAPVMKKIVQIGPEAWFGSQFRDTLLDDEIYPLAISGGGERTKKIVLKDITKILVYADFENAMNREAQQLILDCPKEDNQYEILIKEKNLELKQ